MARRFVPLVALLATLAVAGCNYGDAAELTAQQESARIALIESHPELDDRQLARLCPGLYPRDFLTDPDEWPAGERRDDERDVRFTAADRAEASAAGCDVWPG